MTPNEIENWLVKGYRTTLEKLKLETGWWPTHVGNNQRRATAWCWAFFAHAAKDRCTGRKLTLAANLKGDKGLVLENLWPRVRRAKTRDMEPSEVLLDFSIHYWGSSNPVQLTAESEMYAHHAINESDDLTSNDYSWDFYKLLVVPSQTRLFAARIGSSHGSKYRQRRSRLTKNLEDLVDKYGAAFLRPFDELGAIILPTAKKDIRYTRILWTDRGRLKYQDISEEAAEKLRGD